MKNKLIALMAVIPLIGMFTIMTFTGAASVAVDIPVSGVEIASGAEDGVITVDIAEYENDEYIIVNVLPVNAANREYDLEFSAVEGSEEGSITVEEDGLILPEKTGAVKVTAVTRDGGFRASVIVNVISSKALSADISLVGREDHKQYDLVASDGDADYEVTIPGGEFVFEATAQPVSVTADVTYSVKPCGEDDIAGGFDIHPVTGVAYARLSGQYLVIVKMDPAVQGCEETTVLVTVDCGEGLTVNGSGESEREILLSRTTIATTVYAESADEVTVGEAQGAETSVEPLGGGRYAIEVTFPESGAESASITVMSGDKSVRVTFVFGDTETEIFGRYSNADGNLMQKAGMTATYAAVSQPAAEGLTFRFEVQGEAARLRDQSEDGVCRIEAVAAGEAVIVLYVTENGVETVADSVTLIVVNGYSSFAFTDNAQSWGIGGVYAVGGTDYVGGEFVSASPVLGLKAQRGTATVPFDADEVVFTSSDPSVAEVTATANGCAVKTKGMGRVTITAKWRYSDLFNDGVSASITVDVVADGVNVTDYESLIATTDAKKPVVLQEDVMLGEYMFDADGYLKPGADLSRFVRQIETTADWTYYANRGMSHPTVNYIVEFTADVYGNGKYIDGDYITQVTPMVSVSASVFKGPLNFVAIEGTAAVKAQDNIVFLVRTDDITIDNVVLRGCSDESLYDDGKMELGYLNTVGTVLELMSDCRIINSRIMNGRTGVRAFGRAGVDAVVSADDPVDVEAERIDVEMESCIVQNAREFLVKLGTNRKVRGVFDKDSYAKGDYSSLEPSLTANGVTYEPRDDSNLEDENFVENFVLTDLTLKNCALYNSGLFSVGFESCFAGAMLDGGVLGLDYWDNIGGTSYSAVLHLVGDVRMYNWKSLATVDSSTLIELPGGVDSQTAFLQLNMSEMLNKVCAYGGKQYEDLIVYEGGVQYVHGGIAMYGGGKNYGMVDFSDFDGELPTEYHVNLSVLAIGEESSADSPLYLQGTMLPLAAGTQDFRFFMYNEESDSSIDAQREAFALGTAFSFIKPAER